MQTLAIMLSVSLVAAAGCLEGADPSTSENVDTASAPPTAAADAPQDAGAVEPSDEPTSPTWTVAAWEGAMAVGVLYEIPNHLDETAGPTGAVWSPSFHYEVAEAPQDLEVQLDWTAAAAQMQFMIVVPGNETAGETTLETEFAATGPLCLKVPADLVRAGSYGIMAHSQFAVDARLTFTVASLGGAGALVDQTHSAPATMMMDYADDLTSGGGDAEGPQGEACTRVMP